jgi:hypothetical protein
MRLTARPTSHRPKSSGLGQVLGAAITEDPTTGETTLKLDFPMSKIPGRSTTPAAGGESEQRGEQRREALAAWAAALPVGSGRADALAARLRGQAHLGHGAQHLLQAAENKIARGDSLRTRLYIPEVFTVDQRDAINARRMSQWSQAVAVPGKPQHLMLLIAEVKEIVPARYGFKAVVKHVPDQAFALDEQLYRRLGRRFERAGAVGCSR